MARVRQREIVDGQVTCCRCRHPRPVSWFTVDRHDRLGIGFRCRACRPQGNKLTVVTPDSKVIPISHVKLLKRSSEKMEAGSWERIVRRASIATDREAIMISVGKSYYAHYSAYVGILEASRRMKIKVAVQHGMNEVYVTARIGT